MRKNYLKRLSHEADLVLFLAEKMRPFTKNGTIYAAFGQKNQADQRFSMLNSFAITAVAIEEALGKRPYKSQIIGAIAMADGFITEMATGEGKTIAACFPLSWYATSGTSSIMTSNCYLAERDAKEMAPVYEMLGLTCGYITKDMPSSIKTLMYRSSVVYGSPSQFIFDYLRDNTALSATDLMQQAPHFLLLDEADAILIDEARTPYIISKEAEDASAISLAVNEFILGLKKAPFSGNQTLVSGDVNLSDTADVLYNRATHTCSLSDSALKKAEDFFLNKGFISAPQELWQPAKSVLFRAIVAAAKAHCLYRKDVDYLVLQDAVKIIDPETGRLTPDKRWSEGVHQAVEAKEGIEIQREQVQIARTSIQSFISLYPFKAGMTGTALFSAKEIHDLYGMNVVGIPTNRPSRRKVHDDILFYTKETKFNAIADHVKAIHSTGQPVLVGTGSLKDSEHLSWIFEKASIPHRVLNAKQDKYEADIIAQAGNLGAVTIATSMAGRGTDIILGGLDRATQQEVIALGGLFVIGSERLESRRLDLQLSGRCARQGDPGEVQFYSSLEDDLFRHTGGQYMETILRSFKIKSSEGICHSTIAKTISRNQRTVQGIHSDARKQVLEYDGFLDQARAVFYSSRGSILSTKDKEILTLVTSIRSLAIARVFDSHIPEKIESVADEHLASLEKKLASWGVSIDLLGLNRRGLTRDKLYGMIYEKASHVQIDSSPETIKVILSTMDYLWQDLLLHLETMKSSIHLKAYAQIQPKLALKQEIYDSFKNMVEILPVAIFDDLVESKNKKPT